MTENVISSLDEFDDANIPVDIWLHTLTEDDTEYTDGFRYKLTASNYMPRKQRIEEEALSIISDNKEELQALIKEKIIPIYQKAIDVLNKMVDGTTNNLYYWN